LDGKNSYLRRQMMCQFGFGPPGGGSISDLAFHLHCLLAISKKTNKGNMYCFSKNSAIASLKFDKPTSLP